jgi:Uma2 family endonuclease
MIVKSPQGIMCRSIALLSQYQDLNINEYWIVNPQTQDITILEMTATGYRDVRVSQRHETIASPTFPLLKLLVSEVFA